MFKQVAEVISRFWVVVAFFFILFPYGLIDIFSGAFSLSFLTFIAFAADLLFNGLQWLGPIASGKIFIVS